MGRSKGCIFSPEHRAKINLANKGKKRSEETKQRIRAARTGVKRPDVSLRLKGIKRSDETKRKLSELAKTRVGSGNAFFGKKHSTETKEKLSKIRREKYKERQTINKQVRRYWRVTEWKQKVFVRDNFTCQSCGDRNEEGRGKSVKLEAHHKEELSKIIGDLSFEDAIKLEKLYDVSNGETLCRKCHKEKHKKK